MKEFFRVGQAMGLPAFRLHLADSIANRYIVSQEESPGVLRWFLLHVVMQAGDGHLRSDLESIEKDMAEWYDNKRDPDLPRRVASAAPSIIAMGLAAGWIVRLEGEELTADSLAVPRPPLILSSDGRYLYILKRRREEDRFLEHLTAQAKTFGGSACFFPPQSIPDTPAGALMKRLAQGKRFLILSGGPGTGKTTTVSALIELIALGRQEADAPPVRIVLAAPTGRAAARLTASLAGMKDKGLTAPARTIHGLLGLVPSRGAKHDALNPLAADLVVVDEASMVDIRVMNALLDALPGDASLILVGDPDQLPSVEAGALLGDLLTGALSSAQKDLKGPLTDSIVRLTRVYRSGAGILEAASAIKNGDLKGLLSTFRQPDGLSDSDLSYKGVRLRNPGTPERMARIIAAFYTGDHDERIILTPLRRGPWGVPRLNDRVSLLLGGTTGPFEGMPIIITKNDSRRELWNGDRGAVVREGDSLRAVFPGMDGQRKFPLAALPSWEPAWIQTIHKSQGSEFDTVGVLLPEGADALLTREILYTAFTRARHRVELYAELPIVEATLQRRVVRHSRILRWASGGRSPLS